MSDVVASQESSRRDRCLGHVIQSHETLEINEFSQQGHLQNRMDFLPGSGRASAFNCAFEGMRNSLLKWRRGSWASRDAAYSLLSTCGLEGSTLGEAIASCTLMPNNQRS
jgi:hypothetical protein